MMSIHNSKGLDFPIVFVPLTDYETRHSAYIPTEIVHDWSTGIAGLKINNVTEANYLNLKYGPSARIPTQPVLEDEEKRVLYVAATRAKKEIYFCCLENGSGKEVLHLLEQMFPLLQPREVASSSSFQEASADSPNYEPLQSVLDQWTKVRDVSFLRSGAVADSVTSEAEKFEPRDEDLAMIAARAKRSGGTLVGLLCHGVLERLDFQGSDDPDHLLAIEKGKYSRNFSRQQIDRAAQAAAEILRGFSDSDAFRWLGTAEIIGREVPIVYFDRESRRILSGKIDLLAKEGEKYFIVDYKTDRELTDSMRKRYAEQMRLYSLALAESITVARDTHPPVIQSRLLMVRTGEMIDV